MDKTNIHTWYVYIYNFFMSLCDLGKESHYNDMPFNVANLG